MKFSLLIALLVFPVSLHAQTTEDIVPPPAPLTSPYSIEKLSDIGTNNDFVVGPGKVELKIKPGETRVQNIQVTNRMEEPKIFHIEVEDFAGSNNPEETVILFGDKRGPYSLKNYLSVPAYEFTLQSGERATIPVTISIPADEEPGGRYGSVIASVISSKADIEKGGASTAIISRIGILFFVEVPGAVSKQGSLKEFQAKAGHRIFGGNEISFEILFENTGSVHLNPYGEIRIKNLLGKEVGYINLDPWFTLPGSVRYREVTWERSYLFGMYTAEASINRGYGDKDVIDTDSFTFFILPWKLILPILGGLIIIILLFRFFLSKFEIKKKL